jgi:protein-S-isoprenylcysteine O-methyltransferase Ste14
MRTPPLITHWPYALVYWALFFWAYAPEFGLNRKSRPLPTRQDAGSFGVIMLAQGLAMAIGYFIAFAGTIGVLGHQHVWFVIGLGVLIAGRLLRRHCFRTLGESFTAVVVVRPEQQIIDRGAYRWVRHPSYTAGIMMSASSMLALGNWVSFTIVACATILGYLYRVRVEERALVQSVGEPYRAYMQRTKRFVPKLF